MTIIVNNQRAQIFSISGKTMVENHAYIDSDGDLYICNIHGGGVLMVAAVSVNGKYVVYRDSIDAIYREVNIEINILKD